MAFGDLGDVHQRDASEIQRENHLGFFFENPVVNHGINKKQKTKTQLVFSLAGFLNHH